MPAANADPDLAVVVEEMDREGNVNRAFVTVRRAQKRKEHEAKVAAAAKAPKLKTVKGPFDLVLADPPWRYDFHKDENRRIENHYSTATVPEICGHQPDTKADSILMLWATAPKLLEALEVMKAWGFTYRTHAVWDKMKIGMGFWFRGQHELLLVGTKGNPGCTPECENVSSVFQENRAGHSEKPQCVYQWIERAFPEAVKLEMYAREVRPGWGAWGNEVGVS